MSTPRFQVGDRVRITTNVEDLQARSSPIDAAGKEGVVIGDGMDGNYCVAVPGVGQFFYIERAVLPLAEEANSELADFKKRVLEVAVETANEHNACAAVEEALQKLGIEWKSSREFDVTVRVTCDSRLGNGIIGGFSAPEAAGYLNDEYIEPQMIVKIEEVEGG